VKKIQKYGMVVKINSVFIPSINDDEIPEIAKRYQDLAYIHNIMPIIPIGEFSDIPEPTPQGLAAVRKKAAKYMKQFTVCSQCRADAYGVPGIENLSLSSPGYHG